MVNTRRQTPDVPAPVDGLGSPLLEGKPNPFFVDTARGVSQPQEVRSYVVR